MYCHNCGNKLEENAKFCSNCGEGVKNRDSSGVKNNLDSKSEELKYASTEKRIAARFLDGLLLTAIFFVLEALTDPNFIWFFVVWFYFAGMESSSYQATPGKQAMGIIVTDLDGNRVSFARATGRHFAEFLSMITFFIGYLMIIFTKKKQGLHDMIANCLVINRES